MQLERYGILSLRHAANNWTIEPLCKLHPRAKASDQEEGQTPNEDVDPIMSW